MTVKSEYVLEREFMSSLIKLGYVENHNVKDEDSLRLNLKDKIEKLNNIKLSENEFRRLLNFLEKGNVQSSFEKLRDKQTLVLDNEEEIYIKLVDFDDIEKNSFEITNQVVMERKYTNRYDVTILLNGFPVVQVELKRRGVQLQDAFNQINRYKKHTYSGLFNYIQLFVISNETDTKYFANSDQPLNYKFAFNWSDEFHNKYFNLVNFTKAFLNKEHLTIMIKDYMILNESMKNILVLRPYQYFAAQKVIEKVLTTDYKNIDQNEVDHNGYIWHSTGSGKTLTSFKVSQVLSQNRNIDKVIFLVDRKDLDTQTTEEFNKFQEGSVDNADSTKVLMKQLNDHSNHLILTTIQKMSNAVKRYSDQLEAYKSKRVVFIIDECHRSQFGNMHKIIKSHFQKAQFIGFTGTPIFAANAQNEVFMTSNIFGECIHHYMLKYAISDNNVLPFHVEYNKTFDRKEDIQEEKGTRINIQEIFDNPQRLRLVAEDILKDYHSKTSGKYNAIFATSNIEAAVNYHKIFKEIQETNPHNLKIATIFSYDANEKPKEVHSRDELEAIIEDYNKMFNTNFSTESFDRYRDDISKRMKSGEIDILIVVDMFLTGFDAQVLRVLYVDKNLKYHSLLQAFSRTNRVYDEDKISGIIISYRSIKKDVDEAIRLFNDSDNLDDVLAKTLEEHKEEFIELLNNLKEIVPEPTDEHLLGLRSEESQVKYVLTFRELLKLKKAMEVFANFEFDNEGLGTDENEFAHYQGIYLDLHHKVQNSGSETLSVLKDMNFFIELITVDEITFDYIMMLLEEDISEVNRRKIKNLINRSTDPKLRSKKDMLVEFLDTQNFSDERDIMLRYKEFEDKIYNKRIKEYAEESGLTFDQVEDEILNFMEKEFYWEERGGRARLTDYRRANGDPIKVVELNKLTKKTGLFLQDIYNKFYMK